MMYIPELSNSMSISLRPKDAGFILFVLYNLAKRHYTVVSLTLHQNKRLLRYFLNLKCFWVYIENHVMFCDIL